MLLKLCCGPGVQTHCRVNNIMLVSIILQKWENQKNQLGWKPQNIMPSSLASTQNGYLVRHTTTALLEMMLHIMQINTHDAGKVIEWHIKVQHNVT